MSADTVPACAPSVEEPVFFSGAMGLSFSTIRGTVVGCAEAPANCEGLVDGRYGSGLK